MSSFIDKLKTQLGGYFAKEEDLAPIATTGDYNDLINAPQGGGGGGFTPYIIKIPKGLLEEKILNLQDDYLSYTTQANEGVETSQEAQVTFGIINHLLDIYDIDTSSLIVDKLKFFAGFNNNKYYPYKVEDDNNFVKIYFYDLPLESITLYSTPKALNNITNPISFVIVDGVYEYQYTVSEPDPGIGR